MEVAGLKLELFEERLLRPNGFTHQQVHVTKLGVRSGQLGVQLHRFFQSPSGGDPIVPRLVDHSAHKIGFRPFRSSQRPIQECLCLIDIAISDVRRRQRCRGIQIARILFQCGGERLHTRLHVVLPQQTQSEQVKRLRIPGLLGQHSASLLFAGSGLSRTEQGNAIKHSHLQQIGPHLGGPFQFCDCSLLLP
jgi:hypothetical protein